MPWRRAEPSDGERAYELGCHIWTGMTDDRGRPQVRTVTSSTTGARHRYELEVGAIPPNKQLASLCDNLLCVNPRHHEPMTRAELAYRQGRTKATPARRRHAHSMAALGLSNREIARHLDCSEMTVRRMLKTRPPTPKERRRSARS